MNSNKNLQNLGAYSRWPLEQIVAFRIDFVSIVFEGTAESASFKPSLVLSLRLGVCSVLVQDGLCTYLQANCWSSSRCTQPADCYRGGFIFSSPLSKLEDKEHGN